MTVDELIEKLKQFPGEMTINIGTEADYSANRSEPLFKVLEARQSSYYMVHPIETHGGKRSGKNYLGEVLFL